MDKILLSKINYENSLAITEAWKLTLFNLKLWRG